MNANVFPLSRAGKCAINIPAHSSSAIEMPISLTVSSDWVEGPAISAPRSCDSFKSSRVEECIDGSGDSFSEFVEFAGNIDQTRKVIEGELTVKQYSHGDLLCAYDVTFVANRVMRAAHTDLSEYVGKAIGVKRTRLLQSYNNSSR